MKKAYLTLAGLSGLILIFSGTVAYAVIGQMTIPVAVLVWSGVLMSLVFVYVNFSEIKVVFSGNAARYGANTVIMVAVFIAILVATSLMTMKYKMRIDLTATKRYTLSDHTKKILKSLKKDVDAIAFYRSDERTRQAMEDLLDLYASASPRFNYWFIDPDKKPAEAQRYGVTSYRTTLVKSGVRQESIGFESEERVTNAAIRVTKDDVKTVYFLKGHGENSISDDKKDGYKAAGDSVIKQNFSVKELFLVETPEVPEDASLLIISGPKKELLKDELDKITRYLEKGKSLLVMIDPGTTPEFSDFLAGYGFQIGDDIIIDTLSQVFGANYLVPVVTEYESEHPITEGFKPMTFFPLARTVTVQKTPEAGIFPLAITGKGSWAETDRKELESGKAEYTEGKDKAGPVSVAAVVIMEAGGERSKEKKQDADQRKQYAKIVVVGDSDFANNTHINLAGNRDFFLNTVSWLAEEADMIAIRKKEAGITPLMLTAIQGRLIFWMSVVIPSVVVTVLGFVVFFRRRATQ
ncbi:MAG: GldG family protein [Deltaproteobacteria bacterium]|nr:GldG family protein [Deltaproteobacteria bacterium]